MPVASWDNTVLSTMNSLLTWEWELQKLCGITNTFFIKPLPVGTDRYSIEILNDTIQVQNVDTPTLQMDTEFTIDSIAAAGNYDNLDNGVQEILDIGSVAMILEKKNIYPSHNHQLNNIDIHFVHANTFIVHIRQILNGVYRDWDFDLGAAGVEVFGNLDLTDLTNQKKQDGSYQTTWVIKCTFAPQPVMYSPEIEFEIADFIEKNPGSPLPDDLACYSRIPFPWTDYAFYCLLTASTTPYTVTQVLGSWADKIANAKKILGLDLEKLLTDKGIKVDEQSGKVLLNVIQNPSTFATASDYKSIQLIYEDLAESSLSAELYFKKAEYYGRKYKDELYDAWLRVNLDLTLSGTVEIYRADLIGEIER